jgi:hypothetical protein
MAREPVNLDALLDRIDALVRAHGAVPRADLRSIKRSLPALAARLVERGYEVGATVRMPLEGQILELARLGFVPRKGLEKRLAGATAREATEAAQRLVAGRRLVEVLRESGPGFAAPGGDAIGPADLEELLRCLVKVEKLARRARATRGARPALLREDVKSLLGRWTDAGEATTKAAGTAPGPLFETLTHEIRKRFRENPLPIRVPDLLRALGVPAGVPLEEGQRALVDGAARGLYELEPESGMGRLSREDAELCPAGPMGTRLSWVVARPLEEARR